MLRAGGLEDVHVERVEAPMPASSLEVWWERVPDLAGPLAVALAGMEADVHDAIRRRALDAGAGVARTTGDGIEMDGEVLIGSGCGSDAGGDQTEATNPE